MVKTWGWWILWAAKCNHITNDKYKGFSAKLTSKKWVNHGKTIPSTSSSADPDISRIRGSLLLGCGRFPAQQGWGGGSAEGRLEPWWPWCRPWKSCAKCHPSYGDLKGTMKFEFMGLGGSRIFWKPYLSSLINSPIDTVVISGLF